MRLFLCEKPSQARDIARILGATGRGEGCLNGQGVTVTWCIGHLLETAAPEDYDKAYKKWALEHLPITPQRWKMVVKSQTSAQFRVVQKLLGQATELVIATDADREGEMIARELVDYCGYTGRIMRLWLSALNDASIRRALGELKPGSQTLSMYYSALTRSRSDWLVGMNLSRLFTLLGQQAGYEGVLSVGRVQTPTLGLVVRRDREIARFVAEPYWAIDASFSAQDTRFVAQWLPCEDISDEAGRCLVQTAARQTADDLRQAKSAQVLSVHTDRIKEVPPLVFDLGTLQEVCSRQLALGVQETLDIAQALYETHKVTTYPRSDCGYLPQSMFDEAPTVLDALVRTDPGIATTVARLDRTIYSRVWNDREITAHHGIIPTTQAGNMAAMSDKEQAVYRLIRSYYLAQFFAHHEYERTVAQLQCVGQQFRASGKRIVVPGWRSVLKEEAPERVQASEPQVLPQLRQGMLCTLHDAALRALQTQPPKPYTEGELIKAMKGIARLVTDARLKQKLKETTGIGTQATRAGIIKGLLQRGYLVSKGRSVRATDAAFTLIDAVPPAIVDPGMTALWEQALQGIEKGEMTMEAFLSSQTTWITQLVAQYSHTKLSIRGEDTPVCPLCNATMKKRNGKNGPFWSCSRYPECKGVHNAGSKTTRRPKNAGKTA